MSTPRLLAMRTLSLGFRLRRPLWIATTILVLSLLFPMQGSAQFSGTFTVGGSNPNYATIDAAIFALTNGVTGPVVFLIRSGTYIPPAGGWVLSGVTGLSVTNTVTFKPAPGATVTLSGNTGSNNQSGVFVISGGRYYVIDGSNTAGGTTHDMTIIQTETTFNPAIHILNNADNNTVKYCDLQSVATGSSPEHGVGTVFIGGSTAASGNDNNIIQDCTIGDLTGVRVQYAGVGIYGQSPTLRNTNNRVSGCEVVNFRSFGITLDSNTLQTRILKNVIHMTRPSLAMVCTGIALYEGGPTTTTFIDSNCIYKLMPTPSPSATVYGISCTSLNVPSGTTQITNNMISMVENGYITYYGIYLSNTFVGLTATSQNYTVYYNSIYAGGVASSVAQTTMLYRFSSSASGLGFSSVNHRNNVYYSTRTGGTSTSYGLNIYSSPAGGWTSNNNLINVNSDPNYYTANYNFTQYATLAAYKAAGQDANSNGSNPWFIAPLVGDLHVTAGRRTGVEGRGVAIGGITRDYDGTTRSATTPDMGADEGTFTAVIAVDAAAERFRTPMANAVIRSNTAFTPIGYVLNNGTASQTIPTGMRIRNSSNGVVYYDLQSYTVAPLTSQRGTYGTTGNNGGSTSLSEGNYTLELSTTLSGDGDATNNTITTNLTIRDPLNGHYTINRNGAGLRNYTSFTAAITTLNTVGVAGPVDFDISSGLYDSTTETFPLVFGAIPGASATNTITFRPASGARPRIVASLIDGVIELQDADRVTLDGAASGGTSRDWTISNSGEGPVIRLVDGAQYNTLTNLILLGNSQLPFGVIHITTGPNATSGNAFNTIARNTIGDSTGGFRSLAGIYAVGDTLNRNNTNRIEGNDIINWGKSITAGGYGIYWGRYNSAMKIIGNRLYFYGPTPPGLTSSTAIHVENTHNTADTIAYNAIWELGDPSMTINRTGILVATLGQGAPLVVYNNMISLNGDNSPLAGIYLASGAPATVWGAFNTIHLRGTTGGPDVAAGIRTQTGAMTLRNNVILNERVCTAGIRGYGIYRGTAAATLSSDFNVLAVNGSGLIIGHSNGTNATALADWKLAGFDPSGLSGIPVFIDPAAGNLHLNLAWPFVGENKGTPLAITDDIDHETRIAPPDIGADELTIGGAQILSANGGEMICGGTTLPIRWSARGVGTLKIELSSNSGGSWDTVIASGLPGQSGTYNWKIPSSIAGGTTYRLRVTETGANPIVDESDADFTINAPPTIMQQPTSQVVDIGTKAEFKVNVIGTLPIRYQWQRNGIDISGATSSTFTIDPVSVNDLGEYRVAISNICSPPTVTSDKVTLSIVGQPLITGDPLNSYVCLGDSARFTVVATGAGLTYQWQKNGTPIPGATAATLKVYPVTPADLGGYDVVVKGTSGLMTTSGKATLALHSLPSVATGPTDATICSGDTLRLTVSARGTGLLFQWRRNGTAITGATDSTLVRGDVAATEAGSYDVVVRNPCGDSTTSTRATIVVNSRTAIDTDPLDRTVRPGSSVTFTTSATGTSLTYRWRHNGIAIPGAVGPTHTITGILYSDSGAYDVIVTGLCGPSDTSKVAYLTVDSNASSVELVTTGEEGFTMISIPNPTHGYTQLAITTPYKPERLQGADLYLLDAAGRRVLDLTATFANGGYRRVEFDASTLPSGSYYAELNGRGWRRIVGAVIVVR